MAIVKLLGIQFFKGDLDILKLITINIYLLIKIKYNILIQCRGNYIDGGKPILKLTF